MNKSLSNTVSVLLVCRPGLDQRSLITSVNAMPMARVIAKAGNVDSALSHAQRLKPDVLLVDALLLDEEMERLLAEAKELLSEIVLAVLVVSASQAARWRQEGADFALEFSKLNEQFPQILSHVRNRKDEQAK